MQQEEKNLPLPNALTEPCFSCSRSLKVHLVGRGDQTLLQGDYFLHHANAAGSGVQKCEGDTACQLGNGTQKALCNRALPPDPATLTCQPLLQQDRGCRCFRRHHTVFYGAVQPGVLAHLPFFVCLWCESMHSARKSVTIRKTSC